jgi:chromate transporter
VQLIDLFLCFMQIGALSFGGGYAALPLIQEQVVTLNHWMTLTQFTDLISIAEMTPGPIAVNSATFVGIHLAGLLGAVVATLGVLIPSIIFVGVLGYLYKKYKSMYLLQGVLTGLRPAVVAMIASAGVTIFLLAVFGTGTSKFNPLALAIFAVTLVVLRWKKPNPIVVLLLSGVIGGGIYLGLGIL